jgi:hypothetical protein
MTGARTNWQRVTRERRCPVCGKADWCLVAADGTAALCPRTESAKRCGDAGYLHRLTDTPRAASPLRVAVPVRGGLPDLTALAAEFRRAAPAESLHPLAAELGVSVESLRAFGVGRAANYPAWSFPMTNPATGTITGIRLRPPFGRKFSVRGGKEALFLPAEPANDVLLVLEGETDAIAAHTIGFTNSAGRPSCTGGTAHLLALLRKRKPAQVVIVRDNDEPGTRGANALAATLATHTRDLRVIAPPTGTKDMREWVRAGATRADVEKHTQAAERRRLNITIKVCR